MEVVDTVCLAHGHKFSDLLMLHSVMQLHAMSPFANMEDLDKRVTMIVA